MTGWWQQRPQPGTSCNCASDLHIVPVLPCRPALARLYFLAGSLQAWFGHSTGGFSFSEAFSFLLDHTVVLCHCPITVHHLSVFIAFTKQQLPSWCTAIDTLLVQCITVWTVYSSTQTLTGSNHAVTGVFALLHWWVFVCDNVDWVPSSW